MTRASLAPCTSGRFAQRRPLVSFFVVDAHRNEILLRYFCTPDDRSIQVNGQIVYARFFYNCTRARRLPFKKLFIQVPFAFACKRLHFHPGHARVWSFRSMRQAAGAAHALTGHTLHLMVSSLDGHRSHLNRDRTVVYSTSGISNHSW